MKILPFLGLASTVGIGLALTAFNANADTISIFSTGLDSSGNPLAAGATDPHYIFGPSGLNAGAPVLVDNDPTSLGEIPDIPGSQWVALFDDGTPVAAPATWDFQTTFDLTGLNPSTALLSGSAAVDDDFTIYLNGNNTGQSGVYGIYNPFTISSGFVSGINTLDIQVFNLIGQMGVDVSISGTANPNTPEPGALTLLATSALTGIGLLARRRRKTNE